MVMMRKKIILSVMLPTFYVLLTSSGGNSSPPWEKENVSFPMMNQEIRHSMQENDRQKTMKNWQTTNYSTEVINRKQWSSFKVTTNKIQDRLRFVDFAMQAIPTGYAIFLEGKRIEETQLQIIAEIESAPYSIIAILPAEVKFANDMQMIVRLLTGIVISYGAINQMEKAERKLLLEYALGEVQQLRTDSTIMLMKIRDLKQKVEYNKFLVSHYINKDKKIIEEIMGHF